MPPRTREHIVASTRGPGFRLYVLALMTRADEVRHHVAMEQAVVSAGAPGAALPRAPGLGSRSAAALALLVYVAAVVVLLALGWDGGDGTAGRDGFVLLGLSVPALVLGLLLCHRRPDNPSGAALITVAAGPTVVFALEGWGETAATSSPWPFATAMLAVHDGVWVLVFTGFLALCLVFPDGSRPGRLWRWLPLLFALDALAFMGLVALDPAVYVPGGGSVPGSPPVHLPGVVRGLLVAVALGVLLLVLLAAVLGQVLRYRAGSSALRRQLHLVGGVLAAVPMVLVLGWALTLADVPIEVMGSAVVVVIVVLVPGAVAVAVLRRDLFQIERLLSASVSWLVTTTVASAIFALVVLAAADVGGRSERASVTAAAFVIALVVLPVQRVVRDVVGRVLDRDRTVVVVAVRDFVRRVRDGRAQPEEVERLLRDCLNDPALRLLLAVPGHPRYIDVSGTARTPHGACVPITSGTTEVGLVVLGRDSARRVRLAREAVIEARLPLEVTRLRLELRMALDDARTSRRRLVEATAAERRRLERDLHDGVQQQILAVGMRLRSLQHARRADPHVIAEIDQAVDVLESTVTELRRLAHGVRPSRLDDGLTAALRGLVAASAVPVELALHDVDVDEAVAATAYFVAAESLTNAFKHARADHIRLLLEENGRGVVLEVSDDGRGGAVAGFGLRGLQDRVAAVGGTLHVTSPEGGGTTVRAEFA